MDLEFTELTSLDDERYDDYLDLYQTSFPLNEQMLVSSLNGLLRSIASGADEWSRMVVGIAPDSRVIAMAHYEIMPDEGAAALWYLAVLKSLRSGGIGSRLYREIVGRVTGVPDPPAALVFEVERPDHAHTPEDRGLAERRIEFYRRNGALLLGGVDYVQSVGWQPEVPMHVMVHPLQSMTPEHALQLARTVLGDSVQPTHGPTLD